MFIEKRSGSRCTGFVGQQLERAPVIHQGVGFAGPPTLPVRPIETLRARRRCGSAEVTLHVVLEVVRFTYMQTVQLPWVKFGKLKELAVVLRACPQNLNNW